MSQVTLIALYGHKAPALEELLTFCQQRISDQLRNRFHPYDIQQIHATLVSLEQVPESSRLNLHFAQYRNQQKIMDFAGLLDYLCPNGPFPLQIQLGGFQNRIYPFTSRGQRPYERSFSIQENKSVLIGWPVQNSRFETSEEDANQDDVIYPASLDEFRRTVQGFNILHQYHRNPTDVDNDFYLRLGLIDDAPLDKSLQESVEVALRDDLSRIPPVIIEVSLSAVFVAAYEDETLPLGITQVWPICDNRVTPELFERLYEGAQA